jgi:hypothetical protein
MRIASTRLAPRSPTGIRHRATGPRLMIQIERFYTCRRARTPGSIITTGMTLHILRKSPKHIDP